jgi:hypothetical protein
MINNVRKKQSQKELKKPVTVIGLVLWGGRWLIHF